MVIPHSVPKPHIHTRKPQALLNGITRASHPSPTRPRRPHLRLESRPVTAPPGTSAAQPSHHLSTARRPTRHLKQRRPRQGKDFSCDTVLCSSSPPCSPPEHSPSPPAVRATTATTAAASGGNTTVVIGVDAPLTGDLSALGLGIKNSVDLAAKQANKKKYVEGVTFKIQALDDQAQPVLRPAERHQARRQQGRPRRRRPAELRPSPSPCRRSSTTPSSPRSPRPTPTPPSPRARTGTRASKERPFKSYFRTATTDAVQGPLRRAVPLQRRQEEEGLRHRRQEDLRRRPRRHLQGRVQEARRQGRRHRARQPRDQGLLRGRHQGQELRRRRRLLRRRVPRRPARSASRSRRPAPRSRSSAATASTAPTSSSSPAPTAPATSPPPSARRRDPRLRQGVRRELQGRRLQGAPTRPTAATPTTPPGRSSRPSRPSSRPTTASSPTTPAPRSPRPCSKVSFDGVTGKVSFDEFGDTTNKQLTVYEVKGGDWAAVKSGTSPADPTQHSLHDHRPRGAPHHQRPARLVPVTPSTSKTSEDLR